MVTPHTLLKKISGEAPYRLSITKHMQAPKGPGVSGEQTKTRTVDQITIIGGPQMRVASFSGPS